MSTLARLEVAFRAQLRCALRRAAAGRSPTLFSLAEDRSHSSARALRHAAERILAFRQRDPDSLTVQSLASQYLTLCLRWEHEFNHDRSAVPRLARGLLSEL